MRTYSTKEAAKLAGIHWVTLLKWVSAGKVRASRKLEGSGVRVWVWTSEDVDQLRLYKEKNYWRKGKT